MGKVRVYELAKNMGLENKDLLAKLVEAGIDVSSHSSSLAEEDQRKFEDFINPPVQKIEEARIKPGIIRRRRTVVREPVEQKTEAVEAVATEDMIDEVEAGTRDGDSYDGYKRLKMKLVVFKAYNPAHSVNINRQLYRSYNIDNEDRVKALECARRMGIGR
jgi:FMN phosphatase YigB (HAD superfamily)